jgi:hypothetical protein
MKRHLFSPRQQTRHFLTGTLFALSVLTTGGPASALDGKTYPGIACQPTDQSQVYRAPNSSGIFNPSTTSLLSVNCPVVRDTIPGNSTAGIAQVLMTVVDGNTTAGFNLNCAIASSSSTGQVIEVAITASKNDANPSTQQLTPMKDIASVSGGYYVLNCTIPPRQRGLSGIVMYQVDEN